MRTDGVAVLGILGLLLGACSACERPSPEPASASAPAPAAEPLAERDAGVDASADGGVDGGVDAGLDAVVEAAVEVVLDAGARPAPPVRVRTAGRDRFFEHADAPLRRALASGEIAEVERGQGGRSLAFRVTLADGTRGYFKPEQTFTGTRWYAEIAAYHLDRELGLGRVAPVVGRTVPWSELEAAAGSDARVPELRVDEDGDLRGAFVWWVPERLVPLQLPRGWERWLRVDGEPDAISPFQRPGEYRRARREDAPAEVPEPDRASRPAELSDMIVFDYLAHNADRWGTNNTNVRTVGPGGPLMFLDNAASFTLPSARLPQMDARLHAVQRFRRSTIDAVRRFDPERFAERLANDPLAPELDERQRRHLEVRRAHLLAYVDRLVAEHGEDAVFPW